MYCIIRFVSPLPVLSRGVIIYQPVNCVDNCYCCKLLSVIILSPAVSLFNINNMGIRVILTLWELELSQGKISPFKIIHITNYKLRDFGAYFWSLRCRTTFRPIILWLIDAFWQLCDPKTVFNCGTKYSKKYYVVRKPPVEQILETFENYISFLTGGWAVLETLDWFIQWF